MKLNFSKNQILAGGWHRGIIISAILVLACSGIPTSLAQMKAQKRITSFQSGETSSGTRVSVFSDSALNDYEAFRRGDRFYVKIPLAAFDAAKPNLRGEGFEDLQVQRVGDSIVVSFKLQPGVNARVDQRSNRLDVYFTSPNRATRNATVGNPTRSSSNSIPGIVTLDNSRNQQTRNTNAAGPMPPDTPGPQRPRVVTSQPSYERPSQAPVSARNYPVESSGKTSSRTEAAPSKSAPTPGTNGVGQALKPEGPAALAYSTPNNSYPSSSATPYLTSSSPSTASTRPSSQPVPAGTKAEWSKRFDVVSRWVSANRVPTGIGAAVLLGLAVLASALLYRRRRKTHFTRRSKVPGVQPKYSPALESEEFDDFDGEVYETVFDDYETEARRSTPVVDLPFADDSAGKNQSWVADDFSQSTMAERAEGQPVTSAYMPATPTIPVHAMKHEEYEREVFEL